MSAVFRHLEICVMCGLWCENWQDYQTLIIYEHNSVIDDWTFIAEVFIEVDELQRNSSNISRNISCPELRNLAQNQQLFKIIEVADCVL